MPRAVIIATAFLVAVMAAPASAGEHIDVQDQVFQGDRLKIAVRDCRNGDGWVAVAELQIRPGPDQVPVKYAYPGNRVVIKAKIKADVYPRGRYRAIVTCRHVFDDGTTGEFFTEHEGFNVLEPD